MITKRCVLAGGSGFLGTALAHELLERGYEVTVLTRSPRNVIGKVRQIKWDGKTLEEWGSEIDGAEAVVNLTGKSVNCRYTPENRREIISSRVDSVNAIGRAIQSCKTPPRASVQCASLAIYGDAAENICDENTPHGQGFSADVCELWEQAFDAIETPDTRKVLLRIGFALERDGGALEVLAKLARFYLGGTVGNGRQYISWLHVQDLNRMFLWSIERPEIEGALNGTGPHPVTNAEFMSELRRALHRPWSPPVPAWAVHIGARLLGTEPELALSSRRCVPKYLQDKGFEFLYPNLRDALHNLFA